MSAELRLHPDRLGSVPLTGAVGSVHTAELDVREPVSQVMNRGFLERAAAEYWRVITSFMLGLVCAQTQQRIHRAVTRRFLRRLAETTAG